MPQLDITLNVIWYLCSVIGLGALYLHNIYIYIPFFIRYWKFQDFYKLSIVLVVLKNYEIYFNLLSSNRYFVASCLTIPYGVSSGYKGSAFDLYDLDVSDSSMVATSKLNLY